MTHISGRCFTEQTTHCSVVAIYCHTVRNEKTPAAKSQLLLDEIQIYLIPGPCSLFQALFVLFYTQKCEGGGGGERHWGGQIPLPFFTGYTGMNLCDGKYECMNWVVKWMLTKLGKMCTSDLIEKDFLLINDKSLLKDHTLKILQTQILPISRKWLYWNPIHKWSHV